MTDVELIHGDCLVEMPKLDAGSVDCVICDPPYGIFGGKGGSAAWDVIIPFDAMWANLTRLCKPNAMIILFGTEPFASYLRTDALENDYSITHKYDVIWEKDRPTGFNLANRQPMRCHEAMMHFYKEQPVFNPQKIKGKPSKWVLKKGGKKRNSLYGENTIPQGYNNKTGEKNPRSIVKFNTPNNNHGYRLHPSQKPVDLLCNLVKQNSNAGDTVLDFTAGSGSTGVACIKTGRRFIGIERDPEYFAIMEERLGKPIIIENEAVDWQQNMPLAQGGLFNG